MSSSTYYCTSATQNDNETKLRNDNETVRQRKAKQKTGKSNETRHHLKTFTIVSIESVDVGGWAAGDGVVVGEVVVMVIVVQCGYQSSFVGAVAHIIILSFISNVTKSQWNRKIIHIDIQSLRYNTRKSIEVVDTLCIRVCTAWTWTLASHFIYICYNSHRQTATMSRINYSN